MTHPTADLLRRAAARLRDLATAAAEDSGNANWRAKREFPNATTTSVSPTGCRPLFYARGGAFTHAPIGDYIAAMDPSVGGALADWLDLEADVIDAHAAADPEYVTDTGHDHAEILARRILVHHDGADTTPE